MRLKTAFVLASLLCTTVRVEPAQAAKSSEQQLQAKFAKAQALYDARKFKQALPLFRELLSLSKSPNARLYVARCLRRLNKLGAAYNELRTTARLARELAKVNKRYAGTRDAAAAELVLLAPEVAYLALRNVNSPPRFRVEVDGEELEMRRADRPIAITPGTYDLVLRAEGKQPIRLRGEVVAGGTAVEDAVWLKPGEVAPSNAGPTSFTLSPLRIAGFAGLGLGVAGFVTFGVMGQRARYRYAQLEAVCGSSSCPDEYASYVEGGREMASAANIALAIGSVASAAGLGLVIFGSSSDSENGRTGSSLVVQPLPTGVSLSATF